MLITAVLLDEQNWRLFHCMGNGYTNMSTFEDRREDGKVPKNRTKIGQNFISTVSESLCGVIATRKIFLPLAFPCPWCQRIENCLMFPCPVIFRYFIASIVSSIDKKLYRKHGTY
jgi:hypothetical protein